MMNKRDKKLASIVRGHGTAVNVIEGDLKFALRSLKSILKKTGLMDELYRRKAFVKPSDKRRHEIEYAKYKNKLRER